MLKTAKFIVAGALAGTLLAACGSPAQPGDDISEVTYTYRGAPLHCVVTNRGANSATMSCDFVRWHAENDPKE